MSNIVHGYNEQGNLFPKYVSFIKPKNSAGDDLYLNMAGFLCKMGKGSPCIREVLFKWNSAK